MNASRNAPNVVVRSSEESATAFVANLFKTVACEAVGQRGACHIALAGGTTPHALYQTLATDMALGDIPWPNVQVFFGDERDVPLDHVESNYGMAQRTLLDHVPVDPEHIFPMRADAPDLDAAASEYEQVIRQRVAATDGDVPRFDFVLLGLGGDGHTASLFPDTEALNETQRLVVANFVPVLGRSRMTITFPLIRAARNVVFLVTGDDKGEAVRQLLAGQGGEDAIPACRAIPDEGNLFLVLDTDAARLTGIGPEDQ